MLFTALILAALAARPQGILAGAAPGAQAVMTSAGSGFDAQAARALWESAPPEARAKLEPRLVKELLGDAQPARAALASYTAEPGKTTFIVRLRQQTDPATALKQAPAGKLARRQAMLSALQATARTAQAPLLSLLDQKMQQAAAGPGKSAVRAYQSFFIFNGMAVDADMATALEVAARPEVESLRAVRVHSLEQPVAQSQALPDGFTRQVREQAPSTPSLGGLDAQNWDIDLVDADRVWNELGTRGEGAVVSNIDTGVQWNHPALKKQYRGWNGSAAAHDYNWFEPDGTLYANGDLGPSRSAAPSDGYGHGTHTMGTMVGDGGTTTTHIGMAPGARWIAVSDGSTLNGDLTDDVVEHKCFQWILAPTDLSGARATADPAKAPDVVNCSWGMNDGADLTFQDDLQALRAAGILPVFAAGNTTEQVNGTVGAPASLPEAFAIGATTVNDTLASFSCLGPNLWGQMKPQVSAPGDLVLSTYPGNSYVAMSGTSMAAPHVAGLAALMRSVNPALTVDDLEQFIQFSALDLGTAGPDNRFGYGRINAWQAVQWARGAGWLSGHVENALTHQAIAGALIQAGSPNPFTTLSDDSGNYRVAAPTGSYTVQVSAFGCLSQAFSGISVVSGYSSYSSFSLAPAPAYPISGQVLDAQSQPLAASVHVVDQTTSVATTAGGNYMLQLPAGTWTLEAVARGHRLVRRTLTVGAPQSGIDFTLAAAPRILYVEAERFLGWFDSYPAKEYYKWALTDKGYLFDTLDVTTTTLPTAASLLANYDVLIWQDETYSPGQLTGAGYPAVPLLQAYLAGGGRLILSGQNIAYFDGALSWFTQTLHARYLADSATAPTAGGRNFLAGKTCDFEGTFAQKKIQNAPDTFSADILAPCDSQAFPILEYDDHSGSAALAWHSTSGNDQRLIYFGCGWEALGPRPTNSDILERAIRWLTEPLPAADPNLTGTTWQQCPPGSVVNLAQAVSNNGALSDSYKLSLAGAVWPWAVTNSALTSTITQLGPVAPGAGAAFSLQAGVPKAARIFDEENVVLRAASQAAPAVATTRTVTLQVMPPWSDGGALTSALYRMGYAQTDDQSFYILGGQLASSCTPATWRYDIGGLKQCADKPTLAGNFSAAALGTDIYCPGGYNGSAYLDCLEVYHTQSDTWETRKPLPTPLSGAACASLGGKLYVIGGYDGVALLVTVYVYDPAANAWSLGTPLPVARAYANAAVLGGKIYLAGGWGTNAFSCYDPATGQWQELIPVPGSAVRQSPGVTIYNGYVLVVGGGNGWAALATGYAWDSARGVWIPLKTLSSARRAGCGAAVALNKIWTFGGTDQSAGITASLEFVKLTPLLTGSTLTVDKALAAPGDTLTYTINLAADGPLTGAQISDPIPAGTSYIAGSATGGAVYNAAQNRIAWSGDLADTTPRVFTFQARLGNSTALTSITNTCTFSQPGLTFARNAATLLYLPNLGLRSRKAVSHATAVQNQVLTYTISLVNTGTAPTTVTVTDPLPAGIAFVDTRTPGLAWNAALKRVEGKFRVGVSSLNSSMIATDSVHDGVPFQWIDISASGVNTGVNGDDAGVSSLPIGFAFPFYGKTYTTFGASSNGYLSFGPDLFSLTNTALPTATVPNNLLALFWDDLKVQSGSACYVWYKTFGSAPNRYLVVQYRALPFSGTGTGTLDFEAILYENGAIKFQYLSMTNWSTGIGSGATVGVENATGTQGVTYLYNAAPTGNAIRNNMAVLFTPPIDNSVILTFRARVTTSSRALITNRATLVTTSGQATVVTTSTMVNERTLTATLAPDQAIVTPEDLINGTVRIENKSTTTSLSASGVQLRVPIPAGTSFVKVVSGGATYSSAANAIQASFNIPAGGAAQVVYQLKVDKGLAVETLIQHQARISGTTFDAIDLTTRSVVKRADLIGSAKRVDKAVAASGDTLAYQILVTNAGGYATNAALSDSLPPQVTLVPGSLTATAGSLIWNAAAKRIDWSGTVPAGPAIVQIGYRATVNAGIQTTTITNAALIQWHDPDPAQTTVQAATFIPKVNVKPALRLLTPAQPLEATTASTTIRWTDSDPDDDARITLAYDDPSSRTMVFASGISEDDPANACVLNTGALRAGVYRIRATIDDGIAPPVTTVSLGTLAVGLKLGVTCAFDKSSVRLGDLLTATVKVANNSSTASLAARGVALSMPIPAGTAFDSIVSGPAAFNASAHAVTATLDLTPGAQATVVFKLRVTASHGTVAGVANAVKSPLAPVTGTAQAAILNTAPTVRMLTPATLNTPATTTCTLNWTASDPDDDARITVGLDPDASGGNGTAVGSGLSEDSATRSLTFNTLSVPDGIYYAYVTADDGINPPVTAYAPGTLRIERALALPDIIDYLLGKVTLSPGRLIYADLNADGKVDISDVTVAISRIQPEVPANPSPGVGATGVFYKPILAWTGGAHATSYDLYLWAATQARPATPTASGLTTPRFTVATALAYNKAWLWQVVARKGTMQVDGPVWSFTTEVQPVQVLVPNGGETWTSGTLASVRWKLNKAVAGTSVRIELWRLGRRAAILAANSGDPSGEKIETVTVPSNLTLGGGYLVQVTSLKLEAEGAGARASDTSDGTLSIIAP